MVIDFLLDEREALGLEAALTIRVHRKLMKKLNSKHLTNLTDQENQYYLRILDVRSALMKRDEENALNEGGFFHVTRLSSYHNKAVTNRCNIEEPRYESVKCR